MKDYKFNIKEIFYLSLSSALTAFAVNFFFNEYMLTPGGITGLSITLSSVLNIPIDIISLIISIPLLIISVIVIGQKFTIKTLYIILTIPLFLKIVPSIHLVNNIFLASILGGILVGASISIALTMGCATGGTDTIAIILNKFIKKISVPNMILIIDSLIVLSSYFISNKIYTSIFSGISLFVIVYTIKIGTRFLERKKDDKKYSRRRNCIC